MPKLYLSNPGTYETVTRPVILEVARSMLEVTGLPPEMAILYAGDSQRAIQPGSNIRGDYSVNGNATFSHYDKISIDVEEVHDSDRTFSMAVLQTENRPIFLDNRVGALIKPVYSPQDVVINFKFHSKDRTTAERWRDEIRARVAMGQDQRLHTVKYHYIVPEEFMSVLKEVYRMMRAVAPYNDDDSEVDFDSWFRKYASQRVRPITTLAGTEPQMAASETQMRIVGYFDFETVPEKGEKDSEGTSWTINFTYRFKYEKPVGCSLLYPLVVHNQLIKYRPKNLPPNPDAHQRSYSHSAQALRSFEMGTKLLGVQNGLAIPAFDEFVPRSVPTSTARIFTALTSLSMDPPPATNRLLFNLTEMDGQNKLHARLLRFLAATEWSYLAKLNFSAFNVRLFVNRDMVDEDKVTVNAQLDVLATQNLSLRNYHHIRLGLVENFALINYAGQDRLRSNADVVFLLLMWMDLVEFFPYVVGIEKTLGFHPHADPKRYREEIIAALVADNATLPSIFYSNYISREEWEKLIINMANARRFQGDSFTRQFNTVMSLTLQAYKESDLADSQSNR